MPHIGPGLLDFGEFNVKPLAHPCAGDALEDYILRALQRTVSYSCIRSLGAMFADDFAIFAGAFGDGGVVAAGDGVGVD